MVQATKILIFLRFLSLLVRINYLLRAIILKNEKLLFYEMVEKILYYVERGCSRGAQQRSIISVDSNESYKTDFFKGFTKDQFKFEKGKLICTTEGGNNLEYNIIGPLTKNQISNLLNKFSDLEWGDLTKSTRRIHSKIPHII
jgi:hypothetical protein